MQQLEALRDRVNGGSGRWLRLGLVSTTAIAPLVARWSDLRTAKRDLRMREEAQSRLDGLRAGAQSRVETLRARVDRARQERAKENPLDGLAAVASTDEPARRVTSDNVRLGMWLAGVSLGLIAAGAGAFFLTRRRLATSAEEPLLELPATRAPANGARPDKPPREHRPRQDASSATREAGAAPEESRGAQPESPDAEGVVGPERAGAPDMLDLERETGSSVTPEEAAFVGNMHTMVYHDARDEQHLPAEENRIYFASEEEAREMGYRRARGEVPPAPQADVAVEGPSA